MDARFIGTHCTLQYDVAPHAAEGAFTKGREAEGRKMQKNFAIAKISEEGRGEKEVSGLFVRGECARREEGGGGNARSAPPANFLGEGRD